MDNETENRLSYTRAEYNQLWIFYQQLRKENERLLIESDWLKRLLDAFKETDKENEQLKKAIEDFGNNPAGFDWAILERIDCLERFLKSIANFFGHLEVSDYAETAMEFRASIEEVLGE